MHTNDRSSEAKLGLRPESPATVGYCEICRAPPAMCAERKKSEEIIVGELRRLYA